MKLVQSCNFTFAIYMMLSRFSVFDYRIYAIDLKIKYTTHTAMSASCLDLYLTIDSENLLIMKLYDKRDE